MRRLRKIVAFAIALSAAPAHAKVDTNVVYLNRCAPGGCRVTCTKGMTGRVSSITDETDVCEGGPRTLTKFQFSDAKWSQVVACLEDVFAPFGVAITETDPGAARHFEIMIAGTAGDLGLAGLAGVGSFDCNRPYVDNALAFMFSSTAGATDLTADVEKMCATAAQELAHAFRLDHVADSRDPLSYYNQLPRRYFQDAALPCGSDCVNGFSPLGRACTGPAVGTTGPQLHTCQCTSAPTQNSHATLLDIFGDGAITPPTVAITTPRDHTTVTDPITITGTADDDVGLSRVDFVVDNVTLATSTDPPPYTFAAPADLAFGPHTIALVAHDLADTTATAQITAYVSTGCTTDDDCPQPTDVCVDASRCVAGPHFPGGLGTTCTSNADCVSNTCATGTYGLACVEPCTTACPDGFSCNGSCYPTSPPSDEDRPRGGCATTRGGASSFVLGLAALLCMIVPRRCSRSSSSRSTARRSGCHRHPRR